MQFLNRRSVTLSVLMQLAGRLEGKNCAFLCVFLLCKQ